MWSAVRLALSATVTLPLPSMPPTCWVLVSSEVRSPAISVPLFNTVTRWSGFVAGPGFDSAVESASAEVMPSSSSVAPVATVAVTPVPTIGVPVAVILSVPVATCNMLLDWRLVTPLKALVPFTVSEPLVATVSVATPPPASVTVFKLLTVWALAMLSVELELAPPVTSTTTAPLLIEPLAVVPNVPP